jgi:hypothetical protein
MKFTCDSSSIDEEVNCNCFSPCDEVTYDADIIISKYQKDEIEKTKTEKYVEQRRPTQMRPRAAFSKNRLIKGQIFRKFQ